MALSPNYGWSEPDNSSLVKNGAQDIRALGDAIDTSVWNIGFGQAGKNAIINGNFGIWQRGTSFNFSSTTGYSADRFQLTWNGSGATRTISQQTFTAGAAPVAGYESQFFFRYNQSVAGSGGSGNFFFQPIEDVRTFAGQTVTASFWAKADASRSVPIALEQNFGSGGSGGVSTSLGTAALTTSWVRYTYTATLPSISGKTIGTGSYLNFLMTFPANTVQTIDIWGVQLEYGSKATPFDTATGTLQGELAACQRYYFRSTPGGAYSGYGLGSAFSTTQTSLIVNLPVEMRSTLTIDYGNLAVGDGVAATVLTALAIQYQSKTSPTLVSTVTAGLTQYRPYQLQNNNNTAGYLALSSEL